jgi:hypothetical protein
MLVHHHAQYAARTDHDLAANERVNAAWKLSGQSLAYSYALVELLERGYTGQTWAVMRAIHEVDRLLIAVLSPVEERIPRRWLANQQVRQEDARAAERREVERVTQLMVAAGAEAPEVEVGELSRQIYRSLSMAAHHRRVVVDEAVDHEHRTMTYGADPRASAQLAFTAYAAGILHEVLIHVGDALSQLYGPPFYRDQVMPQLRQFEEVVDTLDSYELIRRLGLV